METKRNITWPYVVPILLLATLLGVYRINADVYWLDEEVSIMLSGGARYGHIPFKNLLSLHLEHTWPPLYNLLTTGWAAFAGWSEYSMRVLALLIGMLSIAGIYRLGSKLVSPQVGIISAFFLGTSAFYIHYLHEARGYTLYVLLAIASIYLYRQILTGSHKTKRSTQGLFLLSVTAMLYTHFIATTIYAFLWGHHILHKPKDIRWHRITRLLLYALLLFSPWIVLGINAAVDESAIPRNMDTFMLLKAILLGFGNWIPLYILGLLTYAAVIIRGKHIGYLWKWAGTVLGLAILINIPTQALYHIRHVIIILPSLLVLMAASVDDIFSRNRAAGITLAVVWAIAGLSGYMSPDFMNNQPAHVRPITSKTMEVMVDTLDACATENDIAVFYAYEPAGCIPSFWQRGKIGSILTR